MVRLGIKTYLFLFSICYLFYSTSFTYISGISGSQLTQFRLSDCGLGWLYATVGFSYALTVLFTAYFGGKSQRKTHWIVGGFLIIAIGFSVLAISAFIASKPIVDDPKMEKHLWKDAFEPFTRDDIANSQNLLKTYWARQFPTDVRDYLNATLYELEPKPKTSSPQKSKREISKREIDPNEMTKIQRHFDFDFGNVPNENSRVKRQLPSYEFPDELRDKLKSGFSGAVIDFYFWGGPYPAFAEALYNLTQDQEIYEKMMRASRLPFGYCRNASSIIRGKLKEEKCQEKITGSSIAGLIVAVIGFICIGVGSTVIWTIGAPLLDDEISKVNLPLCLGLLFGLQAIGFILGYFMSLIFEFKFYASLSPPAGLIPLDPRWIGAWWLGLLIISAFVIIPALFILLFVKFRRNGNKRTPPNETDQELMRKCQQSTKFEGIINTVFGVCRPPIFVALLLALVFDALALKGYFDFLPKFYENNYSPSKLRSALPFWLYSIGILLGGLILRTRKMHGRTVAIFMISCTFIAAIFSLSLSHSSFSCRNAVRQIQENGLKNSSNGRPNWPSCAGCICETADFYPVCANNSDSTPYFSPCHAGCTNFTYELVGTNVEFYFDYCYCAPQTRTRVSRSSCKDDCGKMSILYVLLSSLAALASGCILVPAILFILRTSTRDLRTIALAVAGLAVCIFGFLPSGVIYRFLFDSTCFVWKATCPDSAAQRPICEIFDGPLLRERLHLFLGVLRLISVLFYGLVWFHARNVKLFEISERGDQYCSTELHESPLKNVEAPHIYESVKSEKITI